MSGDKVMTSPGLPLVPNRRVRPVIIRTPHTGTINDHGDIYDDYGRLVRPATCYETSREGLAKTRLGNWRTGPDPRDYPDKLIWANASRRDINAIMAGAYGQAFNLIRDDGGNMFRVPEGFTMEGGSPLEALIKSDSVTGSATSGVYNAIYTAVGTAQILLQRNAFAAFPKEGYMQAGYRARTARGVDSGVGIAEGSACGDAAAPTYQEVAVGLKEHEHNVALSHRIELIAGHDDVIVFAGYAQDAMDDFMHALNADLLGDFNTTANLNIEGVDRLTATSALRAAVSYDDGDEDIYGIDRSTYSWADAYASHDSGSPRTLEKSIVDELHQNCMGYWTAQNQGYNPASKFYLTGIDTWTAWSDVEGAKHRLAGNPVWQSMPGGFQQMPGMAGGFALDEYLNIPIVLDESIQDDGGKRIYLLDGDVSKISMGQPVTVTTSDHPIYVGHYHKMNIYAVLELRCDRFKGNAQCRDLSP